MSARKPLSEADLRAALDELAEDPVADAERVLAALPKQRPPILAMRPLAASVAAMAAGFLVGFLVWGTGSDVTPIGVPPGGEPSRLVLGKPGARDGLRDGMRPAFSFAKTGPQLVVSNGAVTIRKKRKKGEKQDGESWPCPTGVGLPVDSILSTGQNGLAFLRLEDGSDIMLDNNCELQILAFKELALERGEISARIVRGVGNYIIRTPEGRVLIVPEKESGEAVHNILADKRQLRVVSLRGSCKLVSRKEKMVEIVAGFRGLIVKGELDKARKIKFLTDYGEWHRKLEAFRKPAPDIARLYAEREKLLSFLGDEKEWGYVDHLFRRMGMLGVDVLLDFLMKSEAPQDVERRAHAAGIISNTADVRRLDKLFHLLLHKEPRVRVSMFFALERLLGYTQSTNSRFWELEEAGMSEERKKVAQAWREMALKERPLVGYRQATELLLPGGDKKKKGKDK